MLHHGVTREDKETTKLCIVFDGSAKDAKTMYSLNKCLEKGPNQFPHIFDILVKFRRNLIGIVADMKRLFTRLPLMGQIVTFYIFCGSMTLARRSLRSFSFDSADWFLD